MVYNKGGKEYPTNTPPFVNAGTYKKVFYRIIAGDNDTKLETDLENLANIINQCNGRIYGTIVMSDTKVMVCFEIPSQQVLEFMRKHG